VKTVAAARFKEQCLSLLDNLDADGLVITKHGRPVAKLIPYARQSASLIGSLEAKLEIKGELLSTGVPWDADAQP
jgi:prevent-host-death family protein